jgi:hypothetical protein
MTAEVPVQAPVVARFSLALRADGTWGPDDETRADPAVGEWFREHGLQADMVAGGFVNWVPETGTFLAIYPGKDAVKPAVVGG